MEHGQRKQNVNVKKVIEYLKSDDDELFKVLNFYQGELCDGIDCLHKSDSDSLIYLVDQIDSVEIVRTIMKEFAQKDKSKYIAYRDGHLYTYNSVLDYIKDFDIDLYGITAFACENNGDNYFDFPELVYRLTVLYIESFKEVRFKVWYNDSDEITTQIGYIPPYVLDHMIEALQDHKRRYCKEEE